MSTGHVEFEGDTFLEPDTQDVQKHYLAAIASADMMLRNLRGTPGHLQLMFNELLYRQKTTREFKDLLSAFNLAPSRSFTLRQRTEDVIKQLK